MPRVLITGARAPAALDIARSFAAAGHQVHFADSRIGLMARWSGLATRAHRYGSPVSQPLAFRRDLERLLADLKPDLVVPVCEEVFHLARAAEDARWADRLFAPTSDVLDRLHSKLEFARLCDDLGLDAPTTRPIRTRSDLAALAAQADRLVFKAEYSRFGADALVGPSAGALATIAPSEARPWVAQTRVRGREACFYAVAVNGVLTAFSAYGAPWRMAGGVGYAFAPLDVAEEQRLLAMAERLADVVGRGQFACDLIIDADDRPWLIECNPRATSGAHLFGGGRSLADAMTGLAGTPVLGRKTGRLGPAMWRYGLPTAVRERRLARWLADCRKTPDVIGRGGGWAACGAVLDSAAFSIRAALSGASLERAMTRDIEWNGPGGGR